jgi:outer membrane immunogenic protein
LFERRRVAQMQLLVANTSRFVLVRLVDVSGRVRRKLPHYRNISNLARNARPVAGAFMNNRTLLVSLTAALVTSALSSVALPSMASAADLAPAPAPTTYTKAPMISPATNWSGFYGGVNVGYGWGSGDMSLADVTPGLPGISGFPATPQSIESHSNGVIGGGQVGYNWQMGSFVTGLEADIQGSGIRGVTQAPAAFTLTPDPGEVISATSEQNLLWFGTVRGRVGVTVTPDLLLFGTGGLAYGSVRNSGNAIDNDSAFGDGVFSFPASVQQTKTGWAVGAGAEWMFARGWSAKAEYLHIDLGTASATGVERLNNVVDGNTAVVAYHWHNSFDIVRAGVNYHFN